MKPFRILLLLASIASVAFARPLAAQASDVIRGRVTTGDSVPVENVNVTVTSLGGNVSRTVRTDRSGRFTVIFPGSDGDYFVTFTAIGFAPRRFEVKRTADQDILVADAKLSKTGNMLDTITSIGQRARPTRNDVSADVGGSERPVNINNLPPDQAGDLAAMAASLPGVLFIPGANGDPSGFSVLGLGQDQNSSTLNGMDFGGGNIPRDAAVSSSLATSPYDVSRGGFSGGQFNIRPQSGSNFIGRTSSLVLDAPPLQWTDPAARALGLPTTRGDMSGGFSGPISFDKAFYNVSYQLGRSANDFHTLLNTDALGLQTAGVSKDSVARLLNILQGDNVPVSVGHIPSDRLNDRGSVLGSFDFAPPASTSGQAFNITTAGFWNRQSPIAVQTTDLPDHGADLNVWNGSIQGRHTNYYGFGILSETGVAFNASHFYASPYLDIPSAGVLVNSAFDDGTNGLKTLGFGGTPLVLNNSATSAEITNALSWFSANNKHRIKFTTELHRNSFSQNTTSNLLGSFAFNSLSDLQAGQPASFSRTLFPRTTTGDEYIYAMSLGDSYRYSPDLQIVYGARIDGNHFGSSPTLNPDVTSAFGLRNSFVPDRLYASPRVGFSWTYGTAPQIGGFDGAVRGPRAVVRGGIGMFQNTPQATVLTQALNNTGLSSGLQQITCVGAAAPAPNWTEYEQNPASIPTRCADGTAGTVFSSTQPNVLLFAPNYLASRSVRSNLQWTGPVLDNRFVGTFGGTYSLNLDQSSTNYDLNFNPTVRFTLPNEDGRPVYVQPSSIVPSTGAVALGDSRISPLFNRVNEYRSDLHSTSSQLSFSLQPSTFSSTWRWSITYLYTLVDQQTRGFTSTVGNPLAIASALSGQSRHEIDYSLSYNILDAVRVSWSGRFNSGIFYTPGIAGDVNGDGVSGNDRAYIFNPAHTADTALASAMHTLLSSSGRAVRDCLDRQLDRLAGYNSCEGPWTASAYASISFNPIKVRMPQRATLSFNVGNPIGGLDLLMHGQNKLHGWGQPTFPDPTLLYVRGFNPVTQSYQYQVNQRFGATNLANSTVRNPVTFTALVRVDVGPTRERQSLTQTIDRGRKTQGTKLPESMLKAVYGNGGLVNPMVTMLRQADTLGLTTKQADSIATANRWYIVHLDSIWSPVAKYLAALPDHYDQDEAYDRYRVAREASVDLLIKLAPDMTSLLTPEQRRKLPDIVTTYLDQRYLSAVRSGTAGAGGNPFLPLGLPGGGGAQVIVR